jgi:hypothetical protein
VAKYKVTSVKGQLGESTGSLRVGPRDNPTLAARVGDVVELDQEQHDQLKEQGVRLSEVKHEEASAVNEGGDEQSSPETREEQQRAQVASGAMAPPASPETDNTPGARQRAGT